MEKRTYNPLQSGYNGDAKGKNPTPPKTVKLLKSAIIQQKTTKSK